MRNRFSRLPPPPDQDARLWIFKVPPEDIGYVNCVLENTEGMGVVRTRDEKAGVMELWLMPGFEQDFRAILDDLKNDTRLTLMEHDLPLEPFPER